MRYHISNLLRRGAGARNTIKRDTGNLEKGWLHISRASCVSKTSFQKVPPSDEETQELLQKYSKYQPSPISIQHFIEFGRRASPESSFLFLRHELPVRLANIMREIQYLPKELRSTDGCNLIKNHYLQSFKEIVSYINCNVHDPSNMSDFTEQLTTIRKRHSDIVTIMARAVMEVKEQFTSGPEKNRITRLPKFERNIQYFLDRLYTSRISTRMLITQHTLLFSGDHNEKVDDLRVGAIDPYCRVTSLVMRAYENARFLSEQYYMCAPDIRVASYDVTTNPPSVIKGDEGEAKIMCVQIPSHLYHILFELLKNAIRATIEHHGEDSLEFPPVRVCIVKSKEDVTIKISDQGGGIPKRLIKKVFQYLYTTAPNPMTSLSADALNESQLGQQAVPLAGFGYGLPLSRLYARYLSGDLQLYSMDGFGTDAVLYFPSNAENAMERLPVWHETGSKRIYEAQLAPDDWTSSGPMDLRKTKNIRLKTDKDNNSNDE